MNPPVDLPTAVSHPIPLPVHNITALHPFNGFMLDSTNPQTVRGAILSTCTCIIISTTQSMYDRCVIKSKAFANTSATHTTTSYSSNYTRQSPLFHTSIAPPLPLWLSDENSVILFSYLLPAQQANRVTLDSSSVRCVQSVAIGECDLQMSCGDKKFTLNMN